MCSILIRMLILLRICLSGLYQYYFSICGHGLYSDKSRTAEGLTVCKMCGMHISYALMSAVTDTADNKTVS